ncbi:hypothetical protein PF003_g2835 [Phytophthora fragariae]|nr:hypothetical protein PF003_g2835 [Phytophthora fragariae]
MLHAMAALTGMRSPSDQLCLPSEASDHQDSTPQSQEQNADYYHSEHQLVQRRRVMLQEELMVAGHPVLEDVQSALAHVETRAQQHAADMERRMERFMSSTCGTLADVEARLQNQLEDALRATQSVVMTAATDTARSHIAYTDEVVGRVHSQLEAALEGYDAHARAAQEYSGAAQLQACQAHFSETIDSTRHWLEESVSCQTRASIDGTKVLLEEEIATEREHTMDRITQLETRMQLKLDEAVTALAESCAAVEIRAKADTEGLVNVVGDKIQACETHLHNVVDEEVAEVEKRMQLSLDAALKAVELQTSDRLRVTEARLNQNMHAFQLRAQHDSQSGIGSRLEIHLNDLLQASTAHLSTDTTKQVVAEVLQSEARILHTQNNHHQQLQETQADAMKQLEARLMAALRTSRSTDAAKTNKSMKAMEERLDNRMSTFISSAVAKELLKASNILEVTNNPADDNLQVAIGTGANAVGATSTGAPVKTSSLPQRHGRDISAIALATAPTEASMERSDGAVLTADNRTEKCESFSSEERCRGRAHTRKQSRATAAKPTLVAPKQEAHPRHKTNRSALECARADAMRALTRRIEARVNECRKKASRNGAPRR